MRAFASLTLALSFFGGVAPLALAAPAAATAKSPLLSVSAARVPEAPPGARVMAGYVSLANPAATPVTLVGADSPDFAKVTLHQTRKQGGVASMAPVSTLSVPAKGELRFEPGGYHFMLYAPKRPLKVGDHVSLTLRFAGGGSLPITLSVQPRGSGTHH